MSTPLLSFESARVAVGGQVVLDGFDCKFDAGPVALLGDWEPMFGLLTGAARLAAGRAALEGQDLRVASRSGKLGVSWLTATLPLNWRVIDYLRQSAQLLGLSSRDAKKESLAALNALGLGSWAGRKLQTLQPAERSAFMIAHATLKSPRVVALQAPFSGLSESAREWLGRVLDRALESRVWLVSFPDLPEPGTERELFRQATVASVLSMGKIVAQGPPDEVFAAGRRYFVRVGASPDRLLEVMKQLQIDVVPIPSGPYEGLPAGAAMHSFTMDLSPDGSRESQLERLIQAAADHGIPIFHLTPLGLPNKP